MARFVHMRQILKHLPHVLFIPLFYTLIQSCALDVMAKTMDHGRVYLEKKVEEGEWKIIAWVVLDGSGEINYKFNQHIVDVSGNNLTIKKHGNKNIACCNKKVMISSFDIKENERHKLAEFEIEVTYQGEKLGNDSMRIFFE